MFDAVVCGTTEYPSPDGNGFITDVHDEDGVGGRLGNEATDVSHDTSEDGCCDGEAGGDLKHHSSISTIP